MIDKIVAPTILILLFFPYWAIAQSAGEGDNVVRGSVRLEGKVSGGPFARKYPLYIDNGNVMDYTTGTPCENFIDKNNEAFAGFVPFGFTADEEYVCYFASRGEILLRSAKNGKSLGVYPNEQWRHPLLQKIPVMSPDGKYIVFMAEANGKSSTTLSSPITVFLGMKRPQQFALFVDLHSGELKHVVAVDDCFQWGSQLRLELPVNPTKIPGPQKSIAEWVLFTRDSSKALVRQSHYQLDVYNLKTSKCEKSFHLAKTLGDYRCGISGFEWTGENTVRLYLHSIPIPSLSNEKIGDKIVFIDWDIEAENESPIKTDFNAETTENSASKVFQVPPGARVVLPSQDTSNQYFEEAMRNSPSDIQPEKILLGGPNGGVKIRTLPVFKNVDYYIDLVKEKPQLIDAKTNTVVPLSLKNCSNVERDESNLVVLPGNETPDIFFVFRGIRVTSANDGRTGDRIQIWDTKSMKPIQEYPSGPKDNDFIFNVQKKSPVLSGDGKWVVVLGEQKTFVVDLYTGSEGEWALLFNRKTGMLKTHFPTRNCVQNADEMCYPYPFSENKSFRKSWTNFSPDNKNLVVRQSFAQLDMYNIETEKLVKSFHLANANIDYKKYYIYSFSWENSNVLRTNLNAFPSSPAEKDEKKIDYFDWNIADKESGEKLNGVDNRVSVHGGESGAGVNGIGGIGVGRSCFGQYAK